jgi:hypothetical protein
MVIRMQATRGTKGTKATPLEWSSIEVFLRLFSARLQLGERSSVCELVLRSRLIIIIVHMPI